jgi:hypothetical protein
MKYHTDQKPAIGSAIFQEYKLSSKDRYEGFQDIWSSRGIPGQNKTLNGLLPEGILHGKIFRLEQFGSSVGEVNGEGLQLRSNI